MPNHSSVFAKRILHLCQCASFHFLLDFLPLYSQIHTNYMMIPHKLNFLSFHMQIQIYVLRMCLYIYSKLNYIFMLLDIYSPTKCTHIVIKIHFFQLIKYINISFTSVAIFCGLFSQLILKRENESPSSPLALFLTPFFYIEKS